MLDELSGSPADDPIIAQKGVPLADPDNGRPEGAVFAVGSYTQEPFGDTCHVCHSASSDPTANTSRRPS
jgi:hypothetical protein